MHYSYRIDPLTKNTSHIKTQTNANIIESIKSLNYVCSTDFKNIYSVTREDQIITYRLCLNDERTITENENENENDIEWTIFPSGKLIKTIDKIELNLKEIHSKYVRVVARSNYGFTIFQPIFLTPDFIPLYLPIMGKEANILK